MLFVPSPSLQKIATLLYMLFAVGGALHVVCPFPLLAPALPPFIFPPSLCIMPHMAHLHAPPPVIRFPFIPLYNAPTCPTSMPPPLPSKKCCSMWGIIQGDKGNMNDGRGAWRWGMWSIIQGDGGKMNDGREGMEVGHVRHYTRGWREYE